jgi:hypothetical protein
VLLGQALGETDEHIAHVLARSRDRTLAVGIYPVSPAQIVREKAHFLKLLPEARLLFFDSRTHPLADPALRVN